MKTLIIIPSRLSATRLPGKPLLKIKGLSIISHVVQKAKNSNIFLFRIIVSFSHISIFISRTGLMAEKFSKDLFL